MNLFPVGPENRAVTNGMAEMALQIARMQTEIRQLQEALGAQEQAPQEVAGTQEQAAPEAVSTPEQAPQAAVAPPTVELPAQGPMLFRLRPLPCASEEERPRGRSQVVLGAPFIDREPVRAPTLGVMETEGSQVEAPEAEGPQAEAPQAETENWDSGCGCAIVRGWGRL